MLTLEVQSRSIQSITPPLPTITLHLPDEHITVAELIRRTVEEQIRQREAAENKQEAQDVKPIILAESEIEQMGSTGIIRPPREKTGRDLAKEVRKVREPLRREPS